MGMINEPKWVNLKLGFDGKETSYLKDDHRNRLWYCDFIGGLERPSILEIGAGGMYEISILRDRNILSLCDYNIIDISKEVLEMGKERFPNVAFHKGSINKIPFPNNSFDVVYCRHVIEHQPDYEKAVMEMLRVSDKVVIINVFRWTTGKTIISRVKKFSNTYNIFELLEFCKRTCEKVDHFILLKNEQPGVNQYVDQSIIRASDHMIIFLSKKDGNYASELSLSLERYKKFLLMHPYDYEPPIYQPRPRTE